MNSKVFEDPKAFIENRTSSAGQQRIFNDLSEEDQFFFIKNEEFINGGLKEFLEGRDAAERLEIFKKIKRDVEKKVGESKEDERVSVTKKTKGDPSIKGMITHSILEELKIPAKNYQEAISILRDRYNQCMERFKVMQFALARISKPEDQKKISQRGLHEAFKPLFGVTEALKEKTTEQIEIFSKVFGLEYRAEVLADYPTSELLREKVVNSTVATINHFSFVPHQEEVQDQVESNYGFALEDFKNEILEKL